jgi:EAL domain-containing protein (putative c-di-GMP-specific phosphodiesterase class I)
MGVELSLDDFGTGYSSLAYLKRFPVGKLKIDRSFVRDLVVDADDQAIASTIVSMGRNLRLTVLAEGVETAEQLVLLRNMDYDMAQGFLFSRAVPPDQMAELLRTQPFMTKE